MISTQLFVNEASSQSTMRQQLDEHSRILSEILQTQASIQHQFQLPSIEQAPLLSGTAVGTSSVSHTSQRPNAVVRIRAHAYQPQRSSCLPYCKCACHNVRALRSARFLQNVIGALFIGYSGYPSQALQECTEACSVTKLSFQGHVYYIFPAWLFRKALMVTVSGKPLGNISLILSPRPTISNGAEIFRLVGLDDLNGIKDFMRLGLASPNDSDINGDSVLRVRE